MDHPELTFEKLSGTALHWNYWAMCPNLEEPIWMTLDCEVENEKYQRNKKQWEMEDIVEALARTPAFGYYKDSPSVWCPRCYAEAPDLEEFERPDTHLEGCLYRRAATLMADD